MVIDDKNTIYSFRKSYSFLSNMYEHEVKYGGITYPSVENAFQAAKFKDKDTRIEFSKMKPRDAKRHGRSISMSAEEIKVWDTIKYRIMLQLLKVKFSDYILGNKLKNTNPLKLVEGNTWHDNTWGHCTCEKCTTKQHKNMLGVLLMNVREELVDGFLNLGKPKEDFGDDFKPYFPDYVREDLVGRTHLNVEIANDSTQERFLAKLIEEDREIVMLCAESDTPCHSDELWYRILT